MTQQKFSDWLELVGRRILYRHRSGWPNRLYEAVVVEVTTAGNIKLDHTAVGGGLVWVPEAETENINVMEKFSKHEPGCRDCANFKQKEKK